MYFKEINFVKLGFGSKICKSSKSHLEAYQMPNKLNTEF